MIRVSASSSWTILIRSRLKILGRVEAHEHDSEAPALIESFRPVDKSDVIERVILIHIEAFDWNCPQHITARYTVEELEEILGPIREKLATLTAENATLREKLFFSAKAKCLTSDATE